MPPTTTSPATEAPRKVKNSYPFYALRFWAGMRTRAYFRLHAKNGWRAHPSRWAMVLIYAQMAPWNSVLHRLQQWLFGKRIRETKIKRPPIFIIGHWRSGTTHLHELMIRDEQHAFPTTYECFAASHFVLTSKILAPLLYFFLPRKRPMDNVAAGVERPQEDEFALISMGAPTTYFRFAYPRETAPFMDTLNTRDFTAGNREAFREALTYFLRALTFFKSKRLVLKSPPHTGRVEMLAEWFPDAKFIHISRHPYAVVPSMKHTWQSLDEAQSFQFRDEYGAEMDELLFESYERMYKDFDEQQAKVDPANWCEVRYEDLAEDPFAQVESIYQQLGLNGFEHARSALEEYIASLREYKPNQLKVDPDIKRQIDQRWAWYFERFGYEHDA